MIAFDSNILIHAQQDADGQGRHLKAMELIAGSISVGAIVPVQVLGEFLNVCRTKLGRSPRDAVEQVADYLLVFDCPPTDIQHLTDAAFLADRFNLQFFDALIVTVAARFGATVLLSEDMHDGLEVEGLRILNPFSPANRDAVERLLAAPS